MTQITQTSKASTDDADNSDSKASVDDADNADFKGIRRYADEHRFQRLPQMTQIAQIGESIRRSRVWQLVEKFPASSWWIGQSFDSSPFIDASLSASSVSKRLRAGVTSSVNAPK